VCDVMESTKSISSKDRKLLYRVGPPAWNRFRNHIASISHTRPLNALKNSLLASLIGNNIHQLFGNDDDFFDRFSLRETV